MFRITLLTHFLLAICSHAAFLPPQQRTYAGISQGYHPQECAPLGMTTSVVDDEDEDDDEEEVEPGKMRVSEIKSELSMRGVDFSDCFDKESLVERLEEARATGKADPSILETFNKKKLEENVKGEKLEVKDEEIDQMVANDGSLPGGMSPEMLKKLMANPEVMTLLQSTKMQEAMKLMMTGGEEDLEKAMEADAELRDVVVKLNEVLSGAQQ